MEPIDLKKVKTYPIAERANKVNLASLGKPPRPGESIKDFLAGLPDFLAAKDLLTVARAIAAAHREKKAVIVAMGAHVIKVGLSPVVIDLMARGIVTHLALNGAGSIHDCELARFGVTSEDVSTGVKSGLFGMAKETGEFWNQAVNAAAAAGEGLGEGLGKALLAAEAPHLGISLLGNGAKLGLPVTVHVTIGADITHMHASADGAAIGQTSHRDFRLLAKSIATLGPGGVMLNIGSAQLLPMLLEKATTVARNLGHEVSGFIGVNMDMIQHYRALLWPVTRAKELGGVGYAFTGHHEIMLPLLAAAVVEELEREG
jgi:hypothetical protein